MGFNTANADDALLKAIEGEVFAECARLIKEASDSASVIIREAEEESRGIREERMKALDRGIDRRRTCAVANARIRANAVRLKARREVIEEALDGAIKAFEQMPGVPYTALLMRLYNELERAWKALPAAGAPVVLSGERDVGLLAKAGIAARSDPSVSLGVVFASKDGRLRFENTIHSRIEKARSNLVMELNRIIFG